jgi:cyclic pyranopterin monophosphate synthase
MSELTHFDAQGQAHMVDVGGKTATRRVAVASGRIEMLAATLAIIEAGTAKKGDVLGIARIAGIQGAKKTSELIPLCHPLALTDLQVAITPDRAAGVLRIRAEAATTGQTGVEMEAMTAASVAALTVYDMVKGVERGVEIRGVRLISKTGGKSGSWQRLPGPVDDRPKRHPGDRIAGRIGSKRRGGG